MLLHLVLYLSMYFPSAVLSMNLLYLLAFFALTHTPAHARTLLRWGSLDIVPHDHPPFHVYSHSHLQHAHLDIPIFSTNANTNSGSETHDIDLAADPFPSPPQAMTTVEEEKEQDNDDDNDDDWLKWHHEQAEQRDIRRKLECRTVEFGRCDVKRRALRVRTVSVPVPVVEGKGKEQGELGHHDGDGEQQDGDEFVGRRLPRSLQVWLAREGGESGS